MNQLILAYFDESGKLNDSEIVAFSGCAFVQNEVETFSKAWKERLEENGIPYLSMKDALWSKGPFLGWKERSKERDDILKSFALLVSKTQRFSVALPSKEFRALPSHERRKLGNDSQYCGFEVAVKGILASFPDTALHMICDLSEQYAERCVSLYNKLRRENAEVKRRCVAITFADDTVHAPLQAADMIAYCARVHAISTTKQLPIIKELISILGDPEAEAKHWVYRLGSVGLGSAENEPTQGEER